MRWLSRSSARGNPPPVGWSLLILAAAVIGGLAAAELRHVPLLVALLVPLAFGSLTVYGLARWPERQGTPPRPPSPQSHQESRPRPDAISQQETEARVWLQPIKPPSATDGPWWQKADGPAGPPSQEARLMPVPDLASYLASTVIAQCPHCGAFGLEVRPSPGGSSWSFRCHSCGHRWGWRPGTPWPPVHVMPGRRNAPRPPAP
jgi:hypothetical protein